MSKCKAVIFDFDGTLADTVPILRVIYGELARQNNWSVLTDQQYAILRKGTLQDARRWSKIKFWQYPLVIRSARKLMKLEAENVKLFPEIPELVKSLEQKDVDLYVLSRNSPDTIIRVLERYKLQKKLKVLARRRRTLGSKAAVIKKLLAANGYNREDVWMVGDEVRDIEAAKNAGVNSIAVDWGIQDMSILKKHEPTKTVSTIPELQSLLLKLTD